MSKFNFLQSATEAFAFLENHGFTRAEAKHCAVDYRNEYIGVSVFFDSRTGDVDARVFRIDDQLDKFELNLFAAFYGDENADSYGRFVVGSSDGLVSALRKCANGFLKNLPHLLSADEGAFDRLKAYRQKRAVEMANGWSLPGTLQRAEHAWKKHEFGKVVDLLSAVESHLSPAQKKKLTLAKKYATSR